VNTVFTITVEVRHADDADATVLEDWLRRITDQWLVGCGRMDVDAKVVAVVDAKSPWDTEPAETRVPQEAE
jgi:hypothetical protein